MGKIGLGRVVIFGVIEVESKNIMVHLYFERSLLSNYQFFRSILLIS